MSCSVVSSPLGCGSEPIVFFEHVDVVRGPQQVLFDIDLVVRAGEQIALLGPNGCGKSTLIKTMTCECYPLAKENTTARIFGKARWDVAELRKRLGVVSVEPPSSTTLNLSGLDAVLTGFFSSAALWNHMLITDEMVAIARESLSIVEADALASSLVGAMSAGQQRRVLLARALVGNSQLPFNERMVLLDEPTNALDPRAQREVRETMESLSKQGIGVVLITHHVSDIPPSMRRIVMMQKGTIVADADKSQLLTEASLSELFGVHLALTERDGYFHAW